MNLITVDEENCAKCGKCVNECPSDVLSLETEGPYVVLAENCIACGHCVAVCPNRVLNNLRSPLDMQVEIAKFKSFKPEEAEFFLRSRRSIRSYKQDPVPREKLVKLVQIANYAPTGSNTQGVSYLIVDDRDVLKKASDLTVDYLENSPSIRPTLRKILGPLIKKYHETGEDSVLRGAPALVVATSAKNFIQGRINSISCLTYLELFAPHIDLGSCWAGLFEHCATSENSPMLTYAKIIKYT